MWTSIYVPVNDNEGDQTIESSNKECFKHHQETKKKSDRL